MNDINTANADGGGTSRRVFIQRAGLGLVGVASLPALLRTPASSARARRAFGARGRRRAARRSCPAARSSAR